jgi:hypothetical protein
MISRRSGALINRAESVPIDRLKAPDDQLNVDRADQLVDTGRETPRETARRSAEPGRR